MTIIDKIDKFFLTDVVLYNIIKTGSAKTTENKAVHIFLRPFIWIKMYDPIIENETKQKKIGV